MVRLTLFLFAIVAISVMFLFVSQDCRMSRNINGAVKDGIDLAWNETVGRAQKGVDQAAYQVRYKMENTGETLREGALKVDQRALDATITAAVKMKLASDERVSASQINVDTRDGIVTLQGAVSNSEEAAAAVERSQSVEGVRDIVSRLQVRNERSTE